MTTREFLLPDLGEGLTESDIVSWHVAEGDAVELNQIIAEVETAKALVEVPSPIAGVVARLHAAPGETVGVGEPLVTFEVADAGPDAASDAAQAPASAPAPDTAPAPNLVGYGARAERAGRPTRAPRKVAALAAAPSTVAAPTGAAPAGAAPTGERRRSTPPVRTLARELGVDIETVPGSGPGGLVTRDDIEAAAPTATTHPAPGAAPSSAPDTRIPIQGVRKRTAAAMVASAFTAPHATVWTTVDVTPTMDLLARGSATPRTDGARVTLLAVVARAVCIGLRRHPELNSSWDEPAQEIVRHGAVNLGIAAATPRGLVVPNIPDAGALDAAGLAGALAALTEAARAGRTEPPRLAGGTFTITNVGVFGVEGGTPILNPGEAGILAVGAVQRRPWEHDGGIALRQVLTLSLSFDHRLVDGEQGARFLADVAELLADPGLALVLA